MFVGREVGYFLKQWLKEYLFTALSVENTENSLSTELFIDPTNCCKIYWIFN